MRKILIVTFTVLALLFNACKNHSVYEFEPGTYTGSKDGITYILVVDSAMGVHSLGDGYTFTADGQGIERVGSGKVISIDLVGEMVVFTLQPSYQGAPDFRVYTIDIRIVFIESIMTFNDGSTMKSPGSFTVNSGAVNRPGNSIIIQDNGHGYGTADKGSSSIPGTTVTIYATPDPGYAFQGWQVLNGGVILSPNDSTNPATFTMPTNSVTIRAFFTVLNPAIEISGTVQTYDGTPQYVSSYNYVGGITEPEAGDINITYVDINGSEYTHLAGVIDAGVYGIYVSAGGKGGYPTITNLNIGTLIVMKALGDPVSAPVVNTASYSSLRVWPIDAPPALPLASGQSIEYAISLDSGANPSDLDWQPGVIFDGLTADTQYYVFARSQENNNYLAGTPNVSVLISTPIAPAITIAGGNFSLPEGGAIKDLEIEEGLPVDWSISLSGAATINAVTGRVTSGVQGSARITATLQGYPSVTCSVIVSVQRRAWLTDINAIGAQAQNASGEVYSNNAAGDKFTIRAKGQVDSDFQVFSFLYLDLPVTGPFTMMVKIDSVSYGTLTGISPVVGIVAIPYADVTPNPDPTIGQFFSYPYQKDLKYASAILGMDIGSSTRRFWRRVRDTVGNSYEQVQIGLGTAPDTALKLGRWIKLSRIGDDFSAAYSEDGGATWTKVPNRTNHPSAPDEATVVLGDVYVGLWVAAGKSASYNGGYTIAGFSEWSFVNGDGNASQAELSATSARINLSNFY